MGSIMDVARSLAFVLGLILVGETTALSLSTRFSGPSPARWKCPSHIGILISDMMIGLSFLCYHFFTPWFSRIPSLVLVFCCLVGLITHIYREIQYFRSSSVRFCFNKSLFIVNNGKLAGIVWLTGYFIAEALAK